MKSKYSLNHHYSPQTPPINNNLNLYSVDEGFVKGNMFRSLYQGYPGFEPKLAAPTNLEQAMMHEVQKYTFAAHDLALYLDNNPDDEEAIRLFNDYRQKAHEAIGNYESQFGPIQMSSSQLNVYPWGWFITSWPWEGIW